MKQVILILAIIYGCTGAEEYDVFSIGHSLVNYRMPRIFDAIANDDPLVTHRHKEQIFNGAPLKWNWNNAGGDGGGANSKEELATGEYEILVLTEAVPLINHTTWNDTYHYAKEFMSLAHDNNAETQAYIYETWHCINSGEPEGCEWDDNDTIPWRDRLGQDLAKWKAIADSVNDSVPDEKPMLLIPAGQAFAELYDSIQAGKAEGVQHISELFSDDIHPNDIGNYLVACVMYATVYKRSPEGLTTETFDEWGAAFEKPSDALAGLMQRIAWRTVRRVEGTGVTGDVSLLENKISNNYTSGHLLLQDKKVLLSDGAQGRIEILSSNGRLVKSKVVQAGQSLSVESLSRGFYMVQLKNLQGKLIERSRIVY